MKVSKATALTILATVPSVIDAFATAGREARMTPSFSKMTHTMAVRPSKVYSQGRQPFTLQAAVDDTERAEEVERLKAMAAKLRAEAATLEAEQAAQMAEATQKAFDKFDKDNDGVITLEELKEGLEKSLKTELPAERVAKLLEDFDKSGDGTLQRDEFVTVETFRNRLESIARDEKAAALEMAKAAKLEEEASRLLQAQLDVLNDKPPTGSDKLLSVIPYLFPLLDSLIFARFLVLENPENPASIIIALMLALYRAIPFGGFISFLALNVLSGNPRINRLIRFNSQQAIFLDIALFIPSLISSLYTLVLSGAGVKMPQIVTEVGSDIIFFTTLATILYCAISSLLGITPDKIPGISNRVLERMPTLDMFDSQGRFIPQQRQKDDDKKDD